MRTTTLGAAALSALIVVACDSALTDPAPLSPDQARLQLSAQAPGGAFSCPTSFDHLATDDASLQAALAAAAEGDVIGVDGLIATAGAWIDTDGVTLTCASAGSGLYRDPAGSAWYLVGTGRANVTVEGLRLDGQGGSWPVYTVFNSGTRVAHNDITCGFGGCAFVVGVTNAVVTDNNMESWGSSTGLHLQGGIDGARILRNTVVAHAPSWVPAFGGIRPRDGSDVLVKDNTVRGPWQNSISSVDMHQSEYSQNELSGARQYGLAINIPGSPNMAQAAHNTFRGNRISGAAWAGILGRATCGNHLVNNRVSGSLGIQLDVSTGDNHVVGTFGSVIDDGAFDCDGDGEIDPNAVSGKAGHGGRVPAAQPALKTLESPSEAVPAMQ